MRTTALFAGLIVALSSGCLSHPSSHWDKCTVTYQSYLPVALPAHKGHVETVVGHPGRIPGLAASLTHRRNSPREQAAIFNEIRHQLTSQLRHDDYALIGWIGAVGNGRCNFVQLEEALAARAKRWGGDTVLVVSHRLQAKPPFVYIMSGDPRLVFYGRTDHPTFVPSPAHGGVARFPQAEAFVLRSCAGFDEQAERVLALNAEERDILEAKWRAAEAEAAHGQNCGEAIHALGQWRDRLIVGGQVPLPRRAWYTEPSATWSRFAQRRGLLARKTRADIDERLIIQDLVVREITGQTGRSERWGRLWKASGLSEVVE